MGQDFIDQFSLLHAASGVIAYFWGVPFWWWFVGHIVFEVVENTVLGINFINNNFTLWPGGKNKKDSLINSIGDQTFAVIGWVIAAYLDKLYNNETSGRILETRKSILKL